MEIIINSTQDLHILDEFILGKINKENIKPKETDSKTLEKMKNVQKENQNLKNAVVERNKKIEKLQKDLKLEETNHKKVLEMLNKEKK